MEASSRRPTLRENLRSLPPSAWILFGGTFVNRFGTFVMPFLVLYLTRIGYTIAQAGLAVGVYGGGHIIASMLGGHMADRIGRRNTIAVSMFASAATMLALSQARTYPMILILTFCTGLASELYRPASHALIGDLVPQEQRITAFGMYRFAVNLGFAIGPATAGFLAEHSFFYIFLGDAITSVGYGIIALIALPHGLRGHSAGERITEGVRVVLRHRRFVLFLLATLFITWVDFQTSTTFALHVRAQGLSTRVYGLLLSINGGMIVFLELLITSWTQRANPQRAIALGNFLAGAGFALTGIAHNVPVLATTVVIWTFGEMIASPVSGAYITNMAPERYRGRYMGAFVLMYSLGMVIGPTLGTLAFERNPAVLWIACGLCGVLSAMLALVNPREDVVQA
jgi:MFS family permease